MENTFTILVADRNRNVRELLKRELAADGCHILTAGNARDVLGAVTTHLHLDLVILDLDLPDAQEVAVLEHLQQTLPSLPVVVHTLLSDYADHPAVLGTAGFVEKQGNSIEHLKNVVAELLPKSASTVQTATQGDTAHSSTQVE